MKVILYCGNLGPAHGPEYLVELAKYFYDHALNIKIEVIGGGELLESLKIQVHIMGVLIRLSYFMALSRKIRWLISSWMQMQPL